MFRSFLFFKVTREQSGNSARSARGGVGAATPASGPGSSLVRAIRSLYDFAADCCSEARAAAEELTRDMNMKHEHEHET